MLVFTKNESDLVSRISYGQVEGRVGTKYTEIIANTKEQVKSPEFN